MGLILGRIKLRKNWATLGLNVYQIKPLSIPPSSCLFFQYILRIAIGLKRKLMELLMPKIHGSCQWIQTENVEFSIEHRICYLARRFYSGPDARVTFSITSDCKL